MSILLVAALMAAQNPVSAAEPVLGTWRTEVREGIVDIRRCGTSICGKLVTSDGIRADPTLTDRNNKNAALRNRPLRGLPILSGFKPSEGGVWSDGTIYNAEDGKTYSARLTPEGADRLKVRGCIFVPLCKTQTWTRVR